MNPKHKGFGKVFVFPAEVTTYFSKPLHWTTMVETMPHGVVAFKDQIQ